MTTDSTDPRDLLAVAVEVARSAAGQVQRMRAEVVDPVGTKSSDTDPVTVADQAVEQEIVAALARARPHDTVLGEEYGSSGGLDQPTGGPRVRWLLDPIDGTVNYLYGLPWYAVSLAAEVDGTVVAGVVHNPADGREWTAAANHGAYRDGVRLGGSNQSRLAHALVATGFGYQPERRAHQAGVVAALLPRVRDIRRYGAAALDLCLAAEGSVDGYFERGLKPWDLAAGGLIAAEAGLTVAGLHSAPAGPELVVAAPPGLFQQLHDELAALDAAGGP